MPESRNQILAATAELVARDGIAHFRYEDVAESAGVNKTSVYRNWPDREALVVESLIHYAEDLASIADTGDIEQDSGRLSLGPGTCAGDTVRQDTRTSPPAGPTSLHRGGAHQGPGPAGGRHAATGGHSRRSGRAPRSTAPFSAR